MCRQNFTQSRSVSPIAQLPSVALCVDLCRSQPTPALLTSQWISSPFQDCWAHNILNTNHQGLLLVTWFNLLNQLWNTSWRYFLTFFSSIKVNWVKSKDHFAYLFFHTKPDFLVSLTAVYMSLYVGALVTYRNPTRSTLRSTSICLKWKKRKSLKETLRGWWRVCPHSMPSRWGSELVCLHQAASKWGH